MPSNAGGGAPATYAVVSLLLASDAPLSLEALFRAEHNFTDGAHDFFLCPYDSTFTVTRAVAKAA